MTQYNFIVNEDSAKAIVKELGEKVKVEEYEEGYSRVTFLSLTSVDLLMLFHAGQDLGFTRCKNVLGIEY